MCNVWVILPPEQWARLANALNSCECPELARDIVRALAGNGSAFGGRPWMLYGWHRGNLEILAEDAMLPALQAGAERAGLELTIGAPQAALGKRS